MKQKLSLFIALTLLCTFKVFSQGSKQIFESPKLKECVKNHHLVAILPFDVKISYKKPPKDFSAEANRDQELKTGKSIQSGLYTYLLRKADKYTVTFQDIDKTNIMLKKLKLIDSLDSHTKDDIAKALGVDAVIFGRYDEQSTRTQAAAIATAVLFGFGGKTGDSSFTMSIGNGADGELLWRYYKKMNEGMFTSSEDVMEQQMKKLARNFPYSK
ncbi:hypothetical protein [Mucilaginibacter paludis]|uniref:Secreted protein n=1 Tax=Mucilaginibacter paludis DSM 18603 TaxID=714943 RepID=H1Y4A2_9SPHI|nr:hypothetical protein [Mucilaginibacter paludis]EHQ25736.1 secreted protein [Mucilaginibacter paludis DSM 18603]